MYYLPYYRPIWNNKLYFLFIFFLKSPDNAISLYGHPIFQVITPAIPEPERVYTYFPKLRLRTVVDYLYGFTPEYIPGTYQGAIPYNMVKPSTFLLGAY